MDGLRIPLGDTIRSERVRLCRTIACRTVSVGLDGCDSVPSSSQTMVADRRDAVSTSSRIMVAEWHVCPRPAGTGGGEVPVRDVSCSDQAYSKKY